MRSNKALKAGPTISGVPVREKDHDASAPGGDLGSAFDFNVLAMRLAKAYLPPLCSMSVTKPPMTASNINTAALYSWLVEGRDTAHQPPALERSRPR